MSTDNVRFGEVSRPCLYCENRAESCEHVLASGLGGRLEFCRIICSKHNNEVAGFADDPLVKQFEFAVHCLDALKGSGARGTTWHDLEMPDNRTVNIGSDRSTAAKKIDNDAAGRPIRLEGTDESQLQRIVNSLQRSANPPKIVRTENTRVFTTLSKPFQMGDAGLRGVLKSGFHFVAGFATDYSATRNAAEKLWPIIACAQPLPLGYVRFVPYSHAPAFDDFEQHELLAWPTDSGSLVMVTLFGIISYLARVPDVGPREPTRYHQSIRDGSRTVTPTAQPQLAWDDASDIVDEAFRNEMNGRRDQVIEIGLGKKDVIDIVAAISSSDVWQGSSATDRRKALVEGFSSYAAQQQVTKAIKSSLVDFATRRILALVPE